METVPWEERREYLNKLSHRECVNFAIFCAELVVHLNKDERVANAINTAKLWLEGKASKEDCKNAANAAADAADAAYAAYAYAAANAANAAADAAYAAYAANAYAANAYAANAAAADKSLKDKMMRYLWELVHIDEILEKALLGG